MERIVPDEVYNLAAQSHVRVSFDEPEFTGDVTGSGPTRLLEAPRIARCPRGTTRRHLEMFGAIHPPQNEDDRLLPALAHTARRRCTRTG